MASNVDFRRAGTVFAATIVSAALAYLGTSLHPQPWLTWLAPLPLAWIAPRIQARWLALAAFAAGVLGALSHWHYLHGVIALPLGVIVPATLAPGIMLALWVAIEYVRALTSPHGTFDNMAYTQMDMLPVLQLASVTGLWGISFLLMLVPLGWAVALMRDTALRTRIAVSAIVTLALGATLVFGMARLRAPAVESLRIGLVSLEKPIRPALASPEGQALQQGYVAAIDRLAAAGARVVVTPETSFATADTSVPAFADAAQRHGLILAAAEGAPLAAVLS